MNFFELLIQNMKTFPSNEEYLKILVKFYDSLLMYHTDLLVNIPSDIID